jgi:hypothetical protein
MEFTAPTGFEFREEDFTKLKAAGTINDYEFSSTFVRVYVDNLTPSGVSIGFCLEAKYTAESTQPGAYAYDMYHPGIDVTLPPTVWKSY